MGHQLTRTVQQGMCSIVVIVKKKGLCVQSNKKQWGLILATSVKSLSPPTPQALGGKESGMKEGLCRNWLMPVEMLSGSTYVKVGGVVIIVCGVNYIQSHQCASWYFITLLIHTIPAKPHRWGSGVRMEWIWWLERRELKWSGVNCPYRGLRSVDPRLSLRLFLGTSLTRYSQVHGQLALWWLSYLYYENCS